MPPLENDGMSSSHVDSGHKTFVAFSRLLSACPLSSVHSFMREERWNRNDHFEYGKVPSWTELSLLERSQLFSAFGCSYLSLQIVCFIAWVLLLSQLSCCVLQHSSRSETGNDIHLLKNFWVTSGLFKIFKVPLRLMCIWRKQMTLLALSWEEEREASHIRVRMILNNVSSRRESESVLPSLQSCEY